MVQKKKAGLLRPNPKDLESFSGDIVSEDESSYGADDLLTEGEVIRWLHVKKQWLADHRTRVLPIIPHIPMGKQILYPRRAVETWLANLVETRPTWERKDVTRTAPCRRKEAA
jgi:hypothetical protein